MFRRVQVRRMAGRCNHRGGGGRLGEELGRWVVPKDLCIGRFKVDMK